MMMIIPIPIKQIRLLILVPLLFTVVLLDGRQRVEHHLVVELDDSRHVIAGVDSMWYHNHTYDTLREIFFHIWPNGLQSGTSLEAYMTDHGDGGLYFSDRSEQGSLSGLLFRYDRRGLPHEHHEGRSDIVKLVLPQPLAPGASINLHIMFRLQIPGLLTGDLSHSQQAYFLANWFPRPAIYRNGEWMLRPNHYKGRQPGEFSNFTVTLTIPRNYVVVTSGNLLDDPDEEKFLQNLVDRTSRVNRWGNRESARFPASASRPKTLVFHLENAADFVMCLDKRFNALQDTAHITLNGETHIVGFDLYFTVFEAQYWSEAIPVIKQSLRYMAHQTGTIPTHEITFVQTSWVPDSRAFPNLIRIGSVMAPQFLEYSIVQGVADLWFNTRIITDHYLDPWFNRGLPTFYVLKYLRNHYPDSVSVQDVLFDPGMRGGIAGLHKIPANRSLYYLMLKSAGEEEPARPVDPLETLSPKQYQTYAILKTAYAFNTLDAFLGSEVFASIITSYLCTNDHQVVSPEAFTSLLAEVGGEDVRQWFVTGLLSSKEAPDYSLKTVKRIPEGYLLTVKNNMGVATPYPITTIMRHGQTITWHQGHTGSRVDTILNPEHNVRRFVIDNQFVTPEMQRQNNTIRTRGLLRKTELPRFVFLMGLPEPHRKQILYAPVVGWNINNGIMPGIAFYSNPLIKPNTEYLLMPMIGLKDKGLTGAAQVSHHKRFTAGKVSGISVGIEAKQYGLHSKHLPLSYHRIMPWGELHFRGRSKESSSLIRFRTAIITKETESFNRATGQHLRVKDQQYLMNEISYRYRVQRLLNPFTLQGNLQHSGEMLRFFTENRFTISYPSPGQGLSIRIFGGIMLMEPETASGIDTRFTTSGIFTNTENWFSQHDPWFDQIYPGRNHPGGLFRQHMYMVDGGFRRGTTEGNNSRYMLTTNITTSLPGPIPLYLWADVGLFGDEASETYSDALFLYSTGVMISVIRNVMEIYFPFPFAESAAIGERESLNLPDINYFQKIRFVLNLKQLNPLTIPGRLRFN